MLLAAVVLVAALVAAARGAFAQGGLAPEITSAGSFTVDEGTTAVAALTATDDDTAQSDLEWSKTGGADADKFTLSTGGVLALVAAKDFEDPDDADTDGSYEVTVQVSDGSHTDTADVVVTLENVIELTAITRPSTVTFAENTAARVATFAASSDGDRDGIDWILSGTDAAHFSIDSPPGALRFDIDPVAPKILAEPPDFEAPNDSDTDNDYQLTLVARVGAELTASFDVTVTVTDGDEAGSISLSTTRPKVGTEMTATLSDPDGVTDGTATWGWERSTGRNKWAVIDGATSASYTPVAADTDAFLRVTATYDDEHGTGHSVEGVTPNVVTGPLLEALSATTDDSTADPPHGLFPAFSSEVLHYGIGCDTSDTMTITLSSLANARVAVDGVQAASGDATVMVPVTADSDVQIAVTDASGASTVYVVHCLTEVLFDFSTATMPGAAGVLEDLLLFDHRGHIVAIDHNGVPRFRRAIPSLGRGIVNSFKFHRVGDDGDYRYSYSQRSATPRLGVEYTILDPDLQQIDDSVTTVSPIRHTDGHDFRVLPNGNYLLMAYEAKTRDLTKLSFMDPNSSAVEVQDSAIQIATPADQAVLTWNSWDHMALEDCVQHRFPLLGPGRSPPDQTHQGYAHLNSLQLVDGEIVGSFRGCSRVLGIDANTGEVLWRVGRSNLSDEQWAARGIGPAPLSIVNDPLGEFCGQHAASILPNGNLLLFDNGVVCVVNPWTFEKLGRAGEDYSRAVEYALDIDNNEAVYVREHSMHGEKNRYAWSTGGVELLDNGDWLISWGRPRGGEDPLDVSVTQVDPSTGKEKFEISFTDAYKTIEPRARINAVAMPAEALAPQPVALTGAFPASSHTSVFHRGSADSPQVVVEFSRPVVDFDAPTPSLSVSGATVASVNPHLVADEAANAYLVTLIPDGDGAITFGLVADQPCASGGTGGICTADGTTLSEVPSALVIGPPPSVSFERATYGVGEGAALAVGVGLSSAHRGVRGVTVPVLTGAGSASTDDYVAAESVTFEAGETRKTLTVKASHDDLVEGSETVTLEFGSLPDGVSAGSTAVSTVTISDADRAQISFTAAVQQVAEGGEVRLLFAITHGVTFERDQTIALTVGGTATPGDDFDILDAGSRILSAPYAVTFPAGATSVDATVRAVDDTVIEAVAETVTISARLGFTNASLGTRTVTIPPSDVPDTPLVTIVPGGTITESEDAAFTLFRTGANNLPLTSALTVQIQVTATGSTLSGTTPTTVTFEQDNATATLEVATLDNTVIDDSAAVTVLVRGSTSNPPLYLTGADNAATVTVHDNDVAAFNVSAGSSEVNEGRSVSVLVETVDITFAEPQTLELALSGTATPVEDFTIADRNGQDLTSSQRLVLAAGARSASFTIRAGTDSEQDPDETIEISITHDSNSIGVVALTITETAQPPVITGGGGGGGPAAVVEIDGASYAAAGSEVVFTAAVSDGTRTRAVRWTVTGPDGFTATSNTPRLAFAVPAAGGTYTVSVTVEDVRRRTHTGSVTLTVLGDIASHQFGNEIVWLAEAGITAGCAAHSYCPDKPVTRAQMASFLARALDLEAPQQQAGFVDVDPAGVHAANIEALHAAEITKGCTQQPLQYCPDRPVIRAQMASFLARALDLDSPSRRAGFADVDPESVHAVNIEALHAAEITTGCTQEPLQYCPNRPITRAQMAAFLYRARDLISTVRASAGT